MSDTPRTDAFADEHTRDDHLWFAQQCEEFARTLERELAAIKSAELPEEPVFNPVDSFGNEHTPKRDYDALRIYTQRVTAERDALRDEMRQWAKEAADEVSSWGEYAGDYFKAKWNLDGDVKKWEGRLAALNKEKS